MTGPSKPPANRFRASTSPTERGLLSAPMSAIDRGRNRVSRVATDTELKAPHGGPSRSPHFAILAQPRGGRKHAEAPAARSSKLINRLAAGALRTLGSADSLPYSIVDRKPLLRA